MKVDNNFDKIITMLDDKNNAISNVVIKKCEFEIDLSSKSSLSYAHGSENGATINVKKCIFIGQPLENAHHIHVESHSSKVEKTKLNTCIFAS